MREWNDQENRESLPGKLEVRHPWLSETENFTIAKEGLPESLDRECNNAGAQSNSGIERKKEERSPFLFHRQKVENNPSENQNYPLRRRTTIHRMKQQTFECQTEVCLPRHQSCADRAPAQPPTRCRRVHVSEQCANRENCFLFSFFHRLIQFEDSMTVLLDIDFFKKLIFIDWIR
ncbi:hypothetical protein TNCV_2577631 [Trichonephila clavipes]|nr:hypothetical protein TNCV_2577631 [Trichonephila clavipes]